MVVPVLLAMLAVGEVDDLRSIPAEERVAYYNKLANRLTGKNAARDYAKAKKRFVPVYELSMKASDEEKRAAYNHLDYNQFPLAVADNWSEEEKKAIKGWLKANNGALKAIRRGARKERYYNPLAPAQGRLSKVINEAAEVKLVRLCMLARIAANRHAMRDEWKEAYEWNLHAHDISDHLYQQPADMAKLTAMGIERMSCLQLAAFMRRHPPEDLHGLLKALEAGDDRRCPDDVLDQVNQLWLRDYVETWHEWAEDPGKHPDLDSLTEMMFLSTDGLGAELPEASGKRRYDSVEAFRNALRAMTVDQEVKIIEQADGLLARWVDLPFHEAWRNVKGIQEDYCAIAEKAPFVAFFGSCAWGVSQPRLLEEETRMHRTAVVCVIALHQFRRQNGRWPGKLEELTPQLMKTLPIDPFSGKPFIYRPTQEGADFILYSVGADQADDGGKHTSMVPEPGDRVFWPPPVVPRSEE